MTERLFTGRVKFNVPCDVEVSNGRIVACDAQESVKKRAVFISTDYSGGVAVRMETQPEVVEV